MSHNQEVGAYGEDLAEQFLRRKGYKFIDRNVKTSYKEIDLIFLDGSAIVFVEVKTRTSTIYGSAEEAMTDKKINNLKRAAMLYLNGKNKYYKELRFDFLAVDIEPRTKEANIKHYIDMI